MKNTMLTESDKQAIAEAIKQAERGTSGEIVFGIAPASGAYRHASLQAGLAGSVLAAAVYLLIPTAHQIALLLWAEVVGFAVFYAASLHLPLRRWFIRGSEMDERVREAAFKEFYSSGLYKTREANGVLI